MRTFCSPSSLLVLASVTVSALGGCGGGGGGEELRSSLARESGASVSAATVSDTAGRNNDFAFELYRVTRQPGQNQIFSPYSITVALAMTYGGARTTTESQMSAALHFPLPQDPLHPAMNALDQALRSRGAGTPSTFRLNISNAVWGQRDYSYLPQYLDLLAKYYGAGLRLLDFAQSPDTSRTTINNWVASETQDKIRDLLQPGSLTSDTKLVLTNAVYFKSSWLSQFDPRSTRDGSFTKLDGSSVTVPLMTQRGSFAVSGSSAMKAIELPYEGKEVSMVLLVPESGKFDEVEQNLSSSKLSALLGSGAVQDVQLTMPRFRADTTLQLKDALDKLGMKDAFTRQADLSGINGRRELYIDDVHHKAFISVDEAGTEAAAATAVVIGPVSLPQEFRIDRPFLFLIRDVQTGAILFLGRVLSP